MKVSVSSKSIGLIIGFLSVAAVPVSAFADFSYGGSGPIMYSAPISSPVGVVLGVSTTTSNSGSTSTSTASTTSSTGNTSTTGPSCSALLTTYMRRGNNNDVAEVKKLQAFLNVQMHANLPITGYYGAATEAAVKAFQQQYAAQTLTPWGITAPTGYVYKSTQRWINMLYCSSLNIPMPTLN